MARPKGGYKLADGSKAVGVTTVTGRFKESGGLIHWAWKEGVEGRDYRDARDQAGGAGSAAHALIYAWVRDEPEPDIVGEFKLTVEDAELARNGFAGFLSWAEQSHLQLIGHEMPLVSEQYGFAGTPDALGVIGGETVLLDWKTGGSVYSDTVLQLAAYRQLINEQENLNSPVNKAHVIRLDKTWATFIHREFSAQQLDIGWEQFRDLLRCYQRDGLLRSMVK